MVQPVFFMALILWGNGVKPTTVLSLSAIISVNRKRQGVKCV